MRRAVIIGGGLAGLSLATELIDEGFDVTILEKNKYLGGRASNTTDKKTSDPVPIGPHVFVSAYNNMQRFLEKINASHAVCWERSHFAEVVYKGEHHLMKISKLPAPFYLFPMLMKYKFLTFSEKIGGLPFMTKLLLTPQSQLEKLDGMTAYEYLKENHVPQGSIDRFFRFLTISLLNVPLERCSATELAILMKHWLRLRHNRFGFARGGLGEIYTEKAKEYITTRKGKILTGSSVKRIAFGEGKIDYLLVEHNGKKRKITADLYVSTLSPLDLRNLLPEKILFKEFFRHLNAFEGVPYISVSLWFNKKISDKKFWALLETEDTPDYMNTDFYDQSNILPGKRDYSFITSNIIYSGPYSHFTDKQIVEKTLEEIKEAFPRTDAKLVRSKVNRIPYVIYAPYPGMRRHKMGYKTPMTNFYLAGDWLVKELPQCMESAVRSGYRCAEKILRDHSISKKICNDTVI